MRLNSERNDGDGDVVDQGHHIDNHDGWMYDEEGKRSETFL